MTTTLLADFRLALRRAARAPGYTAVCALTLAFAVGATTAVFSVLKASVLDPLPFPEPERLVFITRSGDVSIPDGDDWRPVAPSLESLALFLPNWRFDWAGPGEPVALRGAVVEPEFFAVLSIQPLLGRVLAPRDNQPGAERVALIGEGMWRSRFGAAPDTLGSTILLSGQPTTIVGVMPERVDFMELGWDLFLPVAVETPWALNERGTNNFDAIGRLAGGATLDQARRELRAVCERLALEFPKTNDGKIVVPLPMLDFLAGSARTSLWVMQAAVALLMVLAAASVGSMQLARALGRQREVAVRRALGAGTGRIARLFVADGALIALLAGAGGVAFAAAAARLLLRWSPHRIPRGGWADVDGGVLLFGLSCAAVCALFYAALPLLRLLRAAIGDLGAGGHATAPPSRRRLQGALVFVQVGLACLLVAGSTLLGRSFLALRAESLGFDPTGVLVADLVLPEKRYADPASQTAAFRGAVDRLQSTPGVIAAAALVGVPLSPRGGVGSAIAIDGRTAPADERWSARSRLVYGDYFTAMGQRVVSGRAFDTRDREGGERVAMVNQAFARRFFPDVDPIGQRVARLHWTPEPEWMTVVGVVEDLKGTTLRSSDDLAIYSPYVQRGAPWLRFGALLVKVRGEPRGHERAVRGAVAAVDADLTLEFWTLPERVAAASAPERFNASLLAAFAGVGVLLAAQTVFGLLAQFVAQRRGELAVRAALGAAPRRLRAMVVRASLPWIVTGILAGLAASVALARAFTSLLFGVRPADPLTLLAAGAFVFAVAVAASWIPARRAARLDPATSLRAD